MNKVLEFFIKAKDLSSDVIQRITGKIREWRDSATSAAKETADASNNSAKSMAAVNEAMRKTSVNWKAIAEQEEAEKRRKAEIIALEAELKKAMTEAATASGDAAAMATQRVKMLKDGISQLNQQASSDMNLIGAGMNLLNGNIAGFGKSLLETAKRAGILKTDLIGLSVYGLAIAAVVKIFSWWSEKIDECEKKMRSIKMDGVTTQLGLIERGWKAVNERMEQSIKTAERATQKMNALADARVNKQTAINDQKREAELAGTEDVDERARINRKYDTMNDALTRSARDKKASRELDDERKKLKEIGEAIEQNDALLSRARAVNNREMKERDNIWDDVGDKEDEDYQAANERVKKASEKVKELADKQKALYDEYDKTKNSISVRKANMGATVQQDKADALRKARETAEAEKKAAETKKDEQDKLADELDDIWRDLYNAYTDYQKNKDNEIAKERVRLLGDYYEALEAAENDRERDEIRAEYARQERELNFLKQFEDERLAKEKETENKRAEVEKANKKAQFAQDLEDAKALQKEAQERVSAAQAAVSQAWGWYRNKDSMKTYRDEQEANLAAQKQYQKDYRSLTHGRWSDEFAEAKELQRLGRTDKLEERMAQWRKGSFGLSVEDEATMRVALADEAQKDADRNLAEINDATMRAANAAESIAQLLDNGGQE